MDFAATSQDSAGTQGSSTDSSQAPAPVAILIVDDNEHNLELLKMALSREGLDVLTASDPEEALDIVYNKRPAIVLSDLVMPGMSGIRLLERITEFDPLIDVIIMTAHYTTESAVEAIQKGAADYLNKPVPIPVLEARINRLLEEAKQRQLATRHSPEIIAAARMEGIIGRSAPMWEMFSRIRRVAPHYRTVLITGETGTGKDMVAQAIHHLSPVNRGHFVVLNCSAVVETLFESELFGHVRGAFTGADRDKIGLFEHAHKGTLFLDEIGDMPLATQAKLLRAIQNQEVQRVGSLAAHKVDVRVIAATHRNLKQAIQEKRFREDLYYRLTMVEIHTPRLIDRMEDLPLLTHHFVERFARQYDKPVRGLTLRAQTVLQRYHWPGNVRELENVIGHACMMALNDLIDTCDLPRHLFESERPVESGHAPFQPQDFPPGPVPAALGVLRLKEKQMIRDALLQTGGNQVQAARLLRIGRDALRYKMKKHGLGEDRSQGI